MEWLPISKWKDQTYIKLRLYAKQSEKICITFNPLKISDEPNWNPQWEEWHCYANPLLVYLSDYDILLKEYFDKMYPTKDAFDGTPEQYFDVCSYNWLGTKDWQIVISEIEKKLDDVQADRKPFYVSFLNWIKEALRHTTIIVAEGNQ